MSYNHRKEPDRLKYDIPLHLVTSNKNFKKTCHEIADSLQTRRFPLNRKMVELLNIDPNSNESEGSMSPFPLILFYEKEKIFSIKLSEEFKKLLVMIEKGDYSKGDLQTLREFKHSASNLMYWEIRRRQVFRQTWTTTFDKMREELGYVNSYVDNFKEFKRNVLEIAKKELENTWCSFDYSTVSFGRGGKVSEIKIFFKKGPDDEADSPFGKDREKYPWEEGLLNVKVDPSQLIMIRQHIKAKSETTSKDGNIITWDFDYVNMSIEFARIQYAEQRKKNIKIENLAAWLIAGLIEGYWLDKVEEERAKIRGAVQTVLF